MLNRHGLIAGATGTGKTVTLKGPNRKIKQRRHSVFSSWYQGRFIWSSQSWAMDTKIGRTLQTSWDHRSVWATSLPVRLWDVFGQAGHPVRATVEGMGSLLLSRLLDLNETQSEFSQLSLKWPKKRLALDWFEGPAKPFKGSLWTQFRLFGPIWQYHQTICRSHPKKSLGSRRRRSRPVFGEPALDLNDFMQLDASGAWLYPIFFRLQSSFIHQNCVLNLLIWMLSRLFETLPEVGDPEKPKLVFFFDEAHLLLSQGCKQALSWEGSSKWYAWFVRRCRDLPFITQNPQDLPESVLAQLGNRVQHALRAYTPKEMRAIKVAAQSFRPNPDFDTETVITGN